MRRRLKSLLSCLCDIFWALINYLVCWFCYERGQGCHSVALIPFPSALCAERGFSILWERPRLPGVAFIQSSIILHTERGLSLLWDRPSWTGATLNPTLVTLFTKRGPWVLTEAKAATVWLWLRLLSHSVLKEAFLCWERLRVWPWYHLLSTLCAERGFCGIRETKAVGCGFDPVSYHPPPLSWSSRVDRSSNYLPE